MGDRLPTSHGQKCDENLHLNQLAPEFVIFSRSHLVLCDSDASKSRGNFVPSQMDTWQCLRDILGWRKIRDSWRKDGAATGVLEGRADVLLSDARSGHEDLPSSKRRCCWDWEMMSKDGHMLGFEGQVSGQGEYQASVFWEVLIKSRTVSPASAWETWGLDDPLHVII